MAQIFPRWNPLTSWMRQIEDFLMLNEQPTYGYFPIVHYYQGVAREGLQNAGSADSYRKYLEFRGESTEDPIVGEIRGRRDH